MKYFKLYSNCIPVLGAKNAIICDLFRERYIKIPRNIAVYFLETTISSINDNSTNQELSSLFNTLENDDWGYFTDTPESFPEISLQYEHSGKISNCIIDVSKEIDFPFQKLVTELDELGCRAIQFRCYEYYDLEHVKKLMDFFVNTGIQYFELLLQFSSKYSEDSIKNLLKEQVNLKNIYLFGAPKNEIVTFTQKESGYKWRVVYNKESFENEKSCGKVTKERFVINLQEFTEAKNFNSCLNCKISVDKTGSVRNCPSINDVHGNIINESLENIIKKQNYLQYLSINKDSIEVCKDCEFRYICIDCRAYTVNQKMNTKPLKCTYDPYIGEWL